MIVVKPRDLNEFRKVVEDAKKQGKVIYIAAYPCPECEIMDASLEELGLANDDRIIKIDTPSDDWAVDYVLNELKVSGAPSVILPNGLILDDPDPVELALKVKKYVETAKS